MANIHALITWGSISMIALLISVFYPNINIKEVEHIIHSVCDTNAMIDIQKFCEACIERQADDEDNLIIKLVNHKKFEQTLAFGRTSLITDLAGTLS